MAAQLVLAAMGLCARTAHAEAPRVHLYYEAPAGCPSERDFVESALGRGANFGDRDDGEAREARVTIRRVGAGATEPFTGRLILREPNAEATSRDVSGPTCREVALALAVIVAIELSPEAAKEPAPVEAAPPPRENHAPSQQDEEKQPPAGKAPKTAGLNLVGSVGAMSGVMSSMMPRYEVSAFFGRSPYEVSDASGFVISPTVRIRGGWVGNTTVDTNYGTVRAGGPFGGVDGCLSGARASSQLVVLACLGLETGATHAETFELVPYSVPSTVQWTDIGLSVQAHYYFTEHLFAGATAASYLFLNAPQFVRADTGSVLSASSGGVHTQYGALIGLHF